MIPQTEVEVIPQTEIEVIPAVEAHGTTAAELAAAVDQPLHSLQSLHPAAELAAAVDGEVVGAGADGSGGANELGDGGDIGQESYVMIDPVE